MTEGIARLPLVVQARRASAKIQKRGVSTHIDCKCSVSKVVKTAQKTEKLVFCAVNVGLLFKKFYFETTASASGIYRSAVKLVAIAEMIVKKIKFIVAAAFQSGEILVGVKAPLCNFNHSHGHIAAVVGNSLVTREQILQDKPVFNGAAAVF